MIHPQSPPILDPSLADGAETLRQDEEEIRQAAQLSRRREQPPGRMPGYSISRCLGEGAYGSVWLAREENTGKQVAVKFYTHCRGLDWSLLNREVEKLAVLYTSRNIVRLLEVGWDSDPPYYVMEFLENGSLEQRLAEGPLPAHEAVRLVKAVLHALVHAHGAGILHCDLKPANVLLDANSEARLGDFGQSRLSGDQTPALGTLFYMAPEQADLKAVPDARWDVYAVGALLYQMLSGQAPFRTPEHEERLRGAKTLPEKLAIYREMVRASPKPAEHRGRPGVDRQLAEFVDRALAVDPHKRFPNAQAMLDQLELRDRMRSRRPLMALGIIGPGLLLAAMAPIFADALRSAVASSERMQAETSLDNDAYLGGLLSLSLKRDLDNRLSELRKVAADPELVKAIDDAAGKTKWEDRKLLQRVMAASKASVLAVGNAGDDRHLDTSWFVTDAEGKQIWRDPFNAGTINKPFKYRDYFHGRAREFAGNELPSDLQPISGPHISTAFRSRATLRYMVALSVPIHRLDAEGNRGEFVGILARTTHLGQLLEEYGQRIAAEEEGRNVRFITLVDRREGKLLDHPWMTSENVKPLEDATFEKLTLSDDVLARLAKLPEDETNGSLRLDDYADPVGRIAPEYAGAWLAAFTPVGDTGWMAVVQERKDSALRPVEKMRGEMIRYGIGGLAVACGLIALVWYFVLRALNDRGLMKWRGEANGVSGQPPAVSGQRSAVGSRQ
ncbi:MAG: protein kinase [Planctomycetales bacterium]